MAVELTPNAASHVSAMLRKRGQGIGLRLGTKKSGCTGFAYVVDYADQIEDDDIVFESEGVNVVVKQDDLNRLNGLQVDFVKTNILNQGFEFHNPNVKEMCGCGESFNV
ncbi:MAG: iron-sulfur cluster assembly protein IscA [Sedimenticola sp.]|jgi:iron-sulfur cluster assembly protein|nr:MAG: iron-sulfur cluster assembly protein IscA [Sedimenticola sp.]